MVNFDSDQIETPEPIAIKFVIGDYVRESKPVTKFAANPSTSWRLMGKWVKYDVFDFYWGLGKTFQSQLG